MIKEIITNKNKRFHGVKRKCNAKRRNENEKMLYAISVLIPQHNLERKRTRTTAQIWWEDINSYWTDESSDFM